MKEKVQKKLAAGEPKEKVQLEFIDYLCGSLFNTVTAEDVLRQGSDGKMYYKGTELNAFQVNELILGAQSLQRMGIIRMMLDEMKHLSNQRIYFVARETADLTFGKAMLYTVDIMEKKIAHIASMKLMKEPSLKQDFASKQNHGIIER